MIKEIKNNYDFHKIELKINNYWDHNNIYKKTRTLNKDKKPFFFVDGPPYTTGHIHLGTAWNKIMKDSILRYYSMKENYIIDKPGWDMHGLPIEVKVEEKLGFKTKKDIEKFGISNFIFECKKFALENKKSMTEQFKKLGIWMNWNEPYMTITDEYIESAWWIIKKIHENNLLTNGKRVINWCPRCETAIADSEVEYSEIEDISIYVKFKIKNRENTYLVIWTTTPWTLPSNVAIAVNKDYDYVKIQVFKSDLKTEYIYILKDQIQLILKIGKYLQKYNIIEYYKGTDLENLEYLQPMKIINIENFQHKVVLSSHVTKEKTGCVHIASGHGVDDFYVGIKYNLPIICPINPDGTFNLKNNDEYNGISIFEASKKIIFYLKENNMLIESRKIKHRCGHCWRCNTSIIYRATEQWFVEISKLKEKMIQNISEIKWYPEWAGAFRFKDWVKESRDWCISRQRFWGIPIPIWKCNICNKILVIGTKDELIYKSKCDKNIELHRQFVDKITFECTCGGKMKRINDIFDVWFDSAMASFATVKFPQNLEMFNNIWPSDLILEGHDQTRGWFYSQLGASIASLNRKPYKSVLMHGFTLDTTGKKMSKSVGNVISPMNIIKEFGADVLRLYILSANAPWDDLKYNLEEIKNVFRTVNILWNVYKFPLPYMVLDNFDPQKYNLKNLFKNMKLEDKWILSRLQTLINNIEKSMISYSLHKVLRSIFYFVLEDLSRWYIQLVRERTWTEKNTIDKINVYSCLYYVYSILIKLIAPFAPYITEEMYQNIVKNTLINSFESVHMNKWPVIEKDFLNENLETKMDVIRKIVEIVSNLRQKTGRKLRWPIKKIIIVTKDKIILESVNELNTVLLDQTNSKEVCIFEKKEFFEDSKILIKPIKSKIGPIYKEKLNEIYKLLLNLNGQKLWNDFLSNETLKIIIDKNNIININKEMILFEEQLPEDIGLVNTDFGKIYIDCRLDEELISEGYSREVIRRIQDMRKELQLDLNRLIKVNIFSQNIKTTELLKRKVDVIQNEVRAQLCLFDNNINNDELLLCKSWIIESDIFEISILK